MDYRFISRFLINLIISVFKVRGFVVDGKNGNDLNSGENIHEAFATIGKCVEELKHPGDECLIRDGNYHEIVTISHLMGTFENPIKIAGRYLDFKVYSAATLVIPLNFLPKKAMKMKDQFGMEQFP